MATEMSNPAGEGAASDVVADLRERLLNAAAELSKLVDQAKAEDMNLARWRLVGKYEGVKLALDYLRAYEGGR